jgi:hypothetical protein
LKTATKRKTKKRAPKPAEPPVKITKIAEGFKVSPVEQVLIGGDLAVLTPEQRFNYYLDVCKSLRLNPLTQPFGYISLDGAMTLYAKKDCAEQLRKLNGIGVTDMSKEYDTTEGILTVTVKGKDKWGKVDMASGSVYMKKVFWDNKIKKEYDLTGQERANAMMKCETKAKRRLTLSMSGLSMPDESEVLDIQNVQILETEEKRTGKALEEVKVLPEQKPIDAPIAAQAVPETVKTKEPMGKIVSSFPEDLKKLLRLAEYDTLSKAYEAYQKVDGDLDALRQLCEEKLRRGK